MNPPIPVLLYHRIDETPFSTSTSPQLFRKHMQLLKELGWRSLSADEFGFAMSTGRAPPERSFLITFDDGYECIGSVALGILRELDFKAISFLSTAFLRNPGSAAAMQRQDESAGQYLSWEQARMLQESGVIDCQSHSHTHSNFTGSTSDAITQDLAASVELLAAELRLPKSHFTHLAWPWGLSEQGWRNAAAAVGFQFQYGVSRQAARPGGELMQIPRTCFDATSFSHFQRQLWLQTSHLSPLWEVAYPLGRRLRQLSSRILKAA